MDDWNPDLDILGFALWCFSLPREDGRILDGNGRRLLTWKELSEEVKSGTRFGRQYYEAFEKNMTRSPEIQKEFEEWKKDRPQ